jgi:hypothetical protein
LWDSELAVRGAELALWDGELALCGAELAVGAVELASWLVVGWRGGMGFAVDGWRKVPV